jgi:hypothetical protein
MYKEMDQKQRAYTDKETAHEIRLSLRERFENINTMGLTELVAQVSR